jgi:hypothetical protein
MPTAPLETRMTSRPLALDVGDALDEAAQAAEGEAGARVGDDVGAELDDDAAGGGDVLAGAHRRECATAGGTRERYEEGDSGAVATGRESDDRFRALSELAVMLLDRGERCGRDVEIRAEIVPGVQGPCDIGTHPRVDRVGR